jgi:hypothetical protein
MGFNSNVAFLMTVATGEADMAKHTLRGIRKSHPDAGLFVLDDCSSDAAGENIRQEFNVQLLRNPRSFGYAGIGASVCRLLRHICELNFQVVIKVDPDAYIFDDRIARKSLELFRRFGPGLVGYTTHSPCGRHSRRESWHHGLKLINDSLPIRFLSPTRVGFGAAPISRFFWRSVRNGYIPGQHPISLYALSGRTVEALKCYWEQLSVPYSGLLKSTDEVVVANGVKSIGHKLIRMTEPSEKSLAWIRAQAPLELSDTDIVSGQYSAVHPLKGAEGQRIRSLIDAKYDCLHSQ